MRLYSKNLTGRDVRAAVAKARNTHGADIYIDSVRDFKPRRDPHGVEFFCYSMNGRQATGHRPVGSYPLDGENRAASWDAYGWVISELYALDPDARIGFYKNVDHYRETVLKMAPNRRPRSDAAFLEPVEEVHAS